MHADILRRFQEVAAKCYFCQRPHQGEGFNEQRAIDCIQGVEPFLGTYLCPDCGTREMEMHHLERAKMARHNCVRRLRENGLFDFNPKYKLSEMQDSLIQVPGLYDYLNEWPLTHNAWLWAKTCGIGKTHTARCIGSRYVYNAMDVAELTGPKLFRLSQYREREYEEKLQPYVKSPLAIIDDVDKPIWTLQSIMVVYEVLNERYDRGLRTLITSNANPQYLMKVWDALDPNCCYGASIWDRMFPMQAFEMRGRPRRDEE